MLDNRGLKGQVTIYLDSSDTVGLDVSPWVAREGFGGGAEDGVTITRTAITRDRAVTCRASLAIVSSLFSDYGSDFPELLNVYKNPRFRAGAIIDFKWWNGASYQYTDFGGRQRINAVAPIDPFSARVGGSDQDPIIKDFYGIKIECVQQCERMAYLRTGYDPEIPEGFTLVQNYFLGTARDLKTLSSKYTSSLGLRDIVTKAGDPNPTESTNAYVAYEMDKNVSPLDYAHQILAYNPEEEGKMFFLWQDNDEDMRIGKCDRTIPANSNNVLLDERWGLYSNIEEYLLVTDPRPPLPGKIKVTGRHKYAQLKENPIRRAGGNGGGPSFEFNSSEHHTTTWHSYDNNDWTNGLRLTQTWTDVSGYKLADKTTYSGSFSEQKILKMYRSDRKISELRESNYSVQKVISGREKLDGSVLTTYKRTQYIYDFAGNLIEEKKEEWALPEVLGETSATSGDTKLMGSTSSNQNYTANGSDYSQIRVESPLISVVNANLQYQSSSVTNTPEARAPAPEVQEEPWMEVQLPVWSVITVVFAGFVLDDRILTIDVGDLNFSGNLKKLGTIVMMEQVGGYLQRAIAVGYRQVAGRCAKPGQQMHIYEDQEQEKMVWSCAGGEVIELRADTARYVANLEYIGTMPGGPTGGGAMLAAAANVRRLPNGNVRGLPNGNVLAIG